VRSKEKLIADGWEDIDAILKIQDFNEYDTVLLLRYLRTVNIAREWAQPICEKCGECCEEVAPAPEHMDALRKAHKRIKDVLSLRPNILTKAQGKALRVAKAKAQRNR
jgi:hypothetical protein